MAIFLTGDPNIDLTNLRHIFSLKNPVLRKANCNYCERLLVDIMFNK